MSKQKLLHSSLCSVTKVLNMANVSNAWLKKGRKEYKVLERNMNFTWNQAAAACSRQKAALASADDRDESDFVHYLTLVYTTKYLWPDGLEWRRLFYIGATLYDISSGKNRDLCGSLCIVFYIFNNGEGRSPSV